MTPVDPKELEQNLKTALDEFKIAMEKDPTFVDAKVGTISCLGYLAFMNRKDQARAKELVGQILPLVKEADEMAPTIRGSSGCTVPFFGILLPNAVVARTRQSKIMSAD